MIGQIEAKAVEVFLKLQFRPVEVIKVALYLGDNGPVLGNSTSLSTPAPETSESRWLRYIRSLLWILTEVYGRNLAEFIRRTEW